jgi:PAS domain S-box-containing protein
MNLTPPLLSSHELLDILALSENATAIYTHESIIIQNANSAMIKFWGRDDSVIGQPLEQAVPELKGQPFIGMLQEVWRTGTTVTGTDAPAELMVDGFLQTFYYDFAYRAIKNKAGEVIAILHTATDVTERNLNRQAIKEGQLRESALNAKLVSSNEELAAINGELTAINEELRQSYQSLQLLHRNLAESEIRFRTLLQYAPIGIALLTGPDLVVELANDKMLDIWGRDADVIGLPLLVSRPEVKEHPHLEVLRDVFNTHEPYVGFDIPSTMVKNGVNINGFYDAIYQPVLNADNQVTGIMLVVTEVTERVQAGKEKDKAEQMLRSAIESAQLGTWSLDVETCEMTTSPRLRELFGFTAEEVMSLEAAITQIADDYREMVSTAVDAGINQGKNYNMEYPIVGYHDKKTRWVRATGKLYENVPGKSTYFAGTMFDITEQKENERRKDDFISIASHELKTPVTSLKASLQLLNRMKDEPSAQMLPRLIEQSNKSMLKVSSLIDDLLNVSRMNEGHLHLKKSTFTVSKILNECCDHVKVANKHELIFEGDNNLQVFADENRIDQVLVNLVNNAVKYAANSRNIYIIAEPEDGMAKISVKDGGPGIAPDKLPHLFERYYRADDSGIQYSGLGLGLFISNEIITRHGGKMGVQSVLGQGTTFWFTIPLAA